MHNDHGQFDTRSPLKNAELGVRAKPKWPLLAGAGFGGAIVGWFVPLGLIESVTTATGLSEMIPALAPPLGSTMRMLLALGGGVSALALAAMFLGGRSKPNHKKDSRATPVARDHRSVPEGVHMAPNARPEFGSDYSDNIQQFQRENGEKPMARQANVRKTVRDFDASEAHNDGVDSGGFFGRMKKSLSKLPLPRRFEGDGDVSGPIRDFSDLKRLRPGGHEAVSSRAEMPVRPIAAHAELGEPLPPLNLEPTQPVSPFGHNDHGDDLAELERSARSANPISAPAPSPVRPSEIAPFNAPHIAPNAQGDAQPTPSQPAPETAARAQTLKVLDTAPALAPAQVPVTYDAQGIDALVARLEQALAHVRPIAAAAPVAVEAALDLTAFSEAQRLADEAEAYRAAEEARVVEGRRAEEARVAEERRAEEARVAEECRAEEARQAQLVAEAGAKRRAEAIAAQDAARKAAEEADRAAEEARRRADEAKALLASLGVEQPSPAVQPAVQPVAQAPAPLRAVAQSVDTSVEPEMDDALRSALRTLRRMSNP
jgi:hypothetical protein